MGRRERKKPKKLAKKLREIRIRLALTQTEMAQQVGGNHLTKRDVSAFERGTNEPNLLVLLAYARSSKLSLETLADDNLDLPKIFPSSTRSGGKRSANE